jgi:hypothetical protein
VSEVPASWDELNRLVMQLDENGCRRLLDAELSAGRRKMFVLRIFSRLNRVRAHRERRELLKKVDG